MLTSEALVVLVVAAAAISATLTSDEPMVPAAAILVTVALLAAVPAVVAVAAWVAAFAPAAVRRQRALAALAAATITAALTVEAIAAPAALADGASPVLVALTALTAAAAFRALYVALAAATGHPPAFTARYVSIVHAAGLVALGLLWAPAAGEGSPFRACEEPSRALWVLAARAVPLGYLAHDTHLILSVPGLGDWLMVAHHGVFAVLAYGAPRRFPAHTARAFLGDVPVLFLHAAWLMLHTGAHKTRPGLFRSVCLVLLGTYAAFRLYPFTALALEALGLREWVLAAPLAGLAGLNWYWFGCLVASFVRSWRVAAATPPPSGPKPKGRRRET